MGEYAFSWSQGQATSVGPNPPPDPQDGELWWATADSSGVSVPSGIVLYDQTLTASAPNFDTGPSIPAGYAALMVILSGRSDNAAGNIDNLIRFNGDTGSNYDDAALRTNSGSTNTVNDQAGSAGEFGQVPGAAATANYASLTVAFIPNYSGTTFYKVGTYNNYFEIVPATPSYQAWQGGFTWRSTAAINQINIRPNGGSNYLAGSRLTIIGVGPLTSTGVPDDGWITDFPETWTYASSTTFTVTGDVTSKYTPGTRIKLVQSGAVAYFVVVSSSVSSGTTTVTVTGGSDYTLSNNPISGNRHSYQSNPQGYPGWFNFTPSQTGFSSTSLVIARFSVVGRTCTAYIDITGTSNSTSFGFTLPMPVNSGNTDAGYQLLAWGEDNTVTQSNAPLVAFPSTGTAAGVLKSPITSWTNSGTKRAFGYFTYDV